ncbi:MAG: hypothetical protein MJZ61_09215 [Bacteroidales bacterium]|nr:hypothetical protein [Bacteroidales bacterium]
MKTLLLLLTLFLASCGTLDFGDIKSIDFINMSNDTIIVISAKNPKEYCLPNSLFDYEYDMVVAPGETDSGLLMYDEISINDTVIYFVLKKDIYINRSWFEIKDNGLFSARYILCKKDLEELSNDISYPPTDKMANMNILYNN